MNKKTGGPAFPMGSPEAAMYASCLEDLANPALLDNAERAHLEAKAVALCGMTLRDYFAAKVMSECIGWGEPDKICSKAYEYADAMLKAREQ